MYRNRRGKETSVLQMGTQREERHRACESQRRDGRADIKGAYVHGRRWLGGGWEVGSDTMREMMLVEGVQIPRELTLGVHAEALWSQSRVLSREFTDKVPVLEESFGGCIQEQKYSKKF